MLKKTPITFLILLITIFTSQIYGAAGSLEGKVTDASSGEPLFGANVILLGTSIGAATDIDGKYFIPNVPVGTYTLQASYIGYEKVSIEIKVTDDAHLQENIKMTGVGISSEEIQVTAQASGQNAAINQQLSSENIVNVVSSARIQELPDANAAESIGRLPGVSLVREGGQATQVVIRGLSPQYNAITLAGVPIASNEGGSGDHPEYGGGRGIDMRMISSSSLASIEVSKTNTPDMDAAVLGGTVNLGIRKAHKSESNLFSNAPSVTFMAQGGFNDLINSYENYKADLTLEDRYFGNKFGLLLQGIVQKRSLVSNRLNVDYYQIDKSSDPDNLGLSSLDMYYYPREEKRYNVTVTLDYNLPEGNIALLNILSKSETNNGYLQQEYNLKNGGNNIYMHINDSPLDINLITNILRYEQRLYDIDVTASLSHSYSENIHPDTWTMSFGQGSAGTSNVPERQSPQAIAEQAREYMDPSLMEIRTLTTANDFTKQRDLRASLDLEKEFNIASFLSMTLKTGGEYSNKDRSYNYDYGYGFLWSTEVIKRTVAAYPWLEDYNIPADGSERPYASALFDNGLDFGTYLNGNYTFDNRLNLDYCNTIKEIAVDYGKNLDAAPTGGAGAWVPSMFSCQAYDYSGTEDKSAGYLMGTFNIGQMVTVITGARYQNLTTEYTANRFYNASADNPYPNELVHEDTTISRSHGYWLPALHLKVNPLSWLSIRAAYTNTLAYPNYRAIMPLIHVYTSSVTWNNVDLKPAESENFDVQMSIYHNYMGLFTFGGFLKRIDDFIFEYTSYITDPSDYPGLTGKGVNTKGYQVTAYYNNPNRVDLWGFEGDWQTHFWYLPKPLNNIVLNINYTHVFSEAEYPFTVVENTGYPYYQSIYIDSTYKDGLIDQPDDIVNVSLGYDFKDFSILFSMIYQSSIFNETDFWNSLRTDKDEYLRWDIAAKQKLPWYNVELFLNLNNINGENDTYIIRGSGFPQSDYSYGLTIDFGARLRFD